MLDDVDDPLMLQTPEGMVRYLLAVFFLPCGTHKHTHTQARRLHKSLDMQGLCVYWDLVDAAAPATHATDDPSVEGEDSLDASPLSSVSHACLLQPMTATVDLSSQKELAVEHGGALTTHLRCAVACGRVGVSLTQQQLQDIPRLLNRVLLWQLRNTYAAQRLPGLLWTRVEDGSLSRGAYWR